MNCEDSPSGAMDDSLLSELAQAGLGEGEAERRLVAQGPNVLPGGHRRTLVSIALETVREPMFLLLAAGAPFLSFGDLQEGLKLLGFVLVTLVTCSGLFGPVETREGGSHRLGEL